MNIMNMKPNSGAVIVNDSSLPTGVYYKNKHLINNVNFWHKFIISNTENVPRNVVLRAIIDNVHPLDLIPVCFGKDEHSSCFLARNCGAAIEKLCKDNLTVPNPNDYRPFKLTIVLKFSTTTEFKIDVQKNITSVLQKRYDLTTKTLNLSNFHEDPDLSEFCPLSQPKIMFFVLHLSKSLSPSPECYILCNNLIKILNPVEALTGLKITHMDLRNNLILNIENISPLKSYNITELLLDGNPLCDKIDEQAYLDCIKKYCKKIEKIDGILLKDGNMPTTKTNFLCNPEGFDLVSQFIEHFFTVYDWRNRQSVEALYHKNAMFSLTASYLTGQLSSANAQLRHYNNVARNLLKLADFSRNSEYLFIGTIRIMNLFAQLPPTEHDPYSFKVDLIYYTPRCAMVNVCGVFRELPENLLDPERIFGFTRTFAIEILNGDGECCIINEQLHVYNALSTQVVGSFQVARPLDMNVIPQIPNVKEQQQLADTLKIITNLNTDWAKKCLDECHYDLKKALALFVDLYKVDRIPLDAFTNNKSNLSLETREERNVKEMSSEKKQGTPPGPPVAGSSGLTTITMDQPPSSSIDHPDQTPKRIPNPKWVALADRIASYPSRADWDPDLMQQLQALRPSQVSPSKKWRGRITTSWGRILWVTLPPLRSPP